MAVSPAQMSTAPWRQEVVRSVTTNRSVPAEEFNEMPSPARSNAAFFCSVRRYENEMFLAYFQPATNTYGPIDKLRMLYETAIEDPRIVGLVIGTRPDCIPDEVLDLIDEIAERTYVCLELGVQTIHDASLEWMNRGHGHAASVEAMQRVAGRKFEIGLHIMLGLPGETHEMMMQTADQVALWNPSGVKIHNLYAVHRTRLAEQIKTGEVTLLEMEEYVQLLADFLERLPPQIVIERISGDARLVISLHLSGYLIKAPSKSGSTKCLKNAVHIKVRSTMRRVLLPLQYKPTPFRY